MKTRLDKLILQRGLAPSRERAQALVLAGRVLVNEIVPKDSTYQKFPPIDSR